MSFDLRKYAKGLSEEKKVDTIVRQAKKIQEQDEKLRELDNEIKQLNKQVSDFQDQIEELERASKRQAAPFRVSEKKKKQDPSKPGRKQGHKGSYRKREDREVNEKIKVPLRSCPNCGGTVVGVQPIKQVIEEIPKIKPRIMELTTYQGYCQCCDEEVGSNHPLQVSNAVGAAGTHLGPAAIAFLVRARHQAGLSKSKCCQLLKDEFGISLSRGGLSQLLHRVANKLIPEYNELEAQAREAEKLHVDETSWYVGQPGHWLWTFTNPDFSLYKVDPSRGREVVEQTIGDDFKGVLISDCLVIYEGVADNQQKCYAHHLKAISQAMEKSNNSSTYLKKWKELLENAMKLKPALVEQAPQDRESYIEMLEKEVAKLLRSPPQNESEEKIANRLAKQKDHLFTFLRYSSVPATNNQAERQLRPAVINRKISCGNRTPKGAQTWQILESLATTYQQQNKSFDNLIKNAVRLDNAR